MALATRCPACETIFRISTTQAAAKGGMVRCGQCRHVFNSLDALVRVEDLDVVEEDAATDDAIESGSTVVQASPAVVTAAALTESPARGVDEDEFASLEPGESVDEDVESHDDAVSTTEPHRDPIEGAVFSEWWLPQDESDAARPASETEAPPSVAVDATEDALSDRRASDERSRAASLHEPSLHETSLHEPSFLRTGAPRAERSRAERWTLAVLSIVAAIGLVAQAAYVWRNEIAARWPGAKPWLVAACAPLRCVVDYPAHIDAITIESTAMQSSAPNSNLYILTALLRNRDSVAVRYPYLELTLTDTQDRPILRRALRPQDYLAGARTEGGFAAESELPVRMMFELNDLRFVGYRLDRFYP